ncbi:unnamed protein product [Thelazia callipaeda]|uniref:Peptidase M12B domain-containing protein n=1 Tax=Thelazia callipaeda TaxID=103827 RepID=A0A158RBH3_THECL|nr:unnamed protein product [Thelazia callipaeda]
MTEIVVSCYYRLRIKNTPVTIILLLLLSSTNVAQDFHHHLTKRDIQQIFGVSRHVDVPEYALVNVNQKKYNNGTLYLSFDAWDQNFCIDLKPNLKLLSPHLISVIREGKRNFSSRGLPEHLKADCHFHGKVRSHNNVSAAISYCGHLTGTIMMDDHFLLLQTLPQRITHTQKMQQKHIIYKRDANLLSSLERTLEEHIIKLNEQSVEDAFCDVSKSIDDGLYNKSANITLSIANAITAEGLTFNYTVPEEGKLDSLFIFPQMDPVTLEVGLFLDSKLYEHFQREYTIDAEQHLTDFSLALINNVHVLYQQSSMSPNLDIVIVRFEMWKKQPLGLETIAHRNGQAQALLNLFCRHQAIINPGSDLTDPEHWDHGILLTGYDIYHTTTSVAGVAPVARMCDQIFACSLVEGLHLGRSFVLAHEMGHNMGMVHDGIQNRCRRNCCLMAAVNGAGKTRWSECSVREFNAFLLHLDESGRGNCLRDGSEGLLIHNHLKDGRLPGQRFTADQQCSYFWGKSFEVEIPKGRKMDDICRILWCGNSGSTISTAHPALEGSWCGDNKQESLSRECWVLQFCIEGQCQQWPYGQEAPGRVDGSWTEWSSKGKQCPINQCQITGSIQVNTQMRTCTQPAPNNGGKKCVGSNIRGLTCASVKSTCKALTMLEYGKKLCTAIKNDIEKPDSQLTGDAFLLNRIYSQTFTDGTQSCKVWCRLRGSELVRNKGQYPDGTPCGFKQYCVGGQCLNLMCDNKAIVKNLEDCPSNSEKQIWSDWSTWTECLAPCDAVGIQQRRRRCLLTECESRESVETRSCLPESSICKIRAEWTAWSECSATCGAGVQTRMKICPEENCSDQQQEEKPCQKDKCPTWQKWGTWSACSATCGTGQRSRIRECTQGRNCKGEGSEVESCQTKKCLHETWGDWLPCSVSCGLGFQLRERLCNGLLCSSGQKQARTCNEKFSYFKINFQKFQDCTDNKGWMKLWSDWADWMPCTTSCGEGTQVRIRKCITGNCLESDSTFDQRRCVLRPCPEWSAWNEWSKCLTCTSEQTRHRQRVCQLGQIRGNDKEEECEGESEEVESCENMCEKDKQTFHQKELSNRSVKNIVAEVKVSNIWDEWQEWQECSRTCGIGTRIRFMKEKPSQFQKTNVSAGSDEWSSWSDWSPCSAICGEGVRVRFRKCKAAFVFLCNGISKQERICKNTPCFDNIMPNFITTTISDSIIPKWSDWSNWSECSCFTMNQFRRRFCQILEPSLQGFCVGAITEKRACIPDSCFSENGEWSHWGEWSLCSSKCGTSGYQIRNRMCSNPIPSNRGSYCIGFSFDQQICTPNKVCNGNRIDGNWTPWLEWSQCSDSCTNGHRSRTRFCSNPRPSNGGLQCFGSDYELTPCSDPSRSRNGSWSAWTPWSVCSATCGLSFKSRQRHCSSPTPRGVGKTCSDLAYMTTLCKTDICKDSVDGLWSQWSEWSSCVVGCNNALKTRSRECTLPVPYNGGYPCFGRSVEVKECDMQFTKMTCPNAIQNSRMIESKTFIISE